MPNKQLTAKVRLNTKEAEKSIDNLVKKINKINTVLNKTSSSSGMEAGLHRSVDAANKLNRNLHKTDGLMGSIGGKLKRIAGTYLGIMGTKAILTGSDTITQAENRLNQMNGWNGEVTQQSMDKAYASSQKVHMDYSKMLSNASKSMTLAGDAFDGNIDNAIRFQEIMAETYAVGGASDAEMSSSMYQLVQALGSGSLAGDELRSVREGAPLAYKTIETFVQGVMAQSDATKKYATQSLKDIASEGLVTSEMVVAAIMASGSEIDKQFENNAITFAQVWTNMKNVAMKSFEPILQQLNTFLRSDTGQTIIYGITVAIQLAAVAVQWLVDILVGFFTWVSDNWDWISKLLLTLAVILGGLIKNFIKMGIAAVTNAAKSAMAWLTLSWPLTLIILILAAIIIALIWVSDSFEDACGIVVGVIMGAVSAIWNIFFTLMTFVVEVIIGTMLGAFDMLANFLYNFAVDPVGSIIQLFAKLGDFVLDVLHTIAMGIDSVFGTSLADKVNGWRDKLSTKADLLVEKWGSGEYEEKSNVREQISVMLDDALPNALWDTSDAYQTGYDWGYNGASWVTDKLGNLLSGLNLPNSDDDKYSVTNSYDGATVEELLSGINNDVGNISDSMDLSNDDLEYLRKIAEMEWRNEFTTAEIKVDMTNHNTVSAERDLDGIVEYLSDVLREEMTNVAYGVHY